MSKTLGQILDNLNIEFGTTTTVDWNQVRIQASIAAMQAELSNSNNEFMMCEDKKAIIARMAVRQADALIVELKKGGQDESRD